MPSAQPLPLNEWDMGAKTAALRLPISLGRLTNTLKVARSMTAKHTGHEITAFLASDRAETFFVMGPWSVGKTFARKQYLAEAARGSSTARNYAYVSLFGLSSRDELRRAIDENTVPASNAGTAAT